MICRMRSIACVKIALASSIPGHSAVSCAGPYCNIAEQIGWCAAARSISVGSSIVDFPSHVSGTIESHRSRSIGIESMITCVHKGGRGLGILPRRLQSLVAVEETAGMGRRKVTPSRAHCKSVLRNERQKSRKALNHDLRYRDDSSRLRDARRCRSSHPDLPSYRRVPRHVGRIWLDDAKRSETSHSSIDGVRDLDAVRRRCRRRRG